MAVTRAVSHGREPVYQCPATHDGADKEPNSTARSHSKEPPPHSTRIPSRLAPPAPGPRPSPPATRRSLLPKACMREPQGPSRPVHPPALGAPRVAAQPGQVGGQPPARVCGRPAAPDGRPRDLSSGSGGAAAPPPPLLSSKLEMQAEILNHGRYTDITERYCMTHSDTGHRNSTAKSSRDFSQLSSISSFEFCRCHADQYML